MCTIVLLPNRRPPPAPRGGPGSWYLTNEAAELRIRALGRRLAHDLEFGPPDVRTRLLRLPRPLVILALGFLLNADGRRPEAQEYAVAVALGRLPVPR